ncbi:VOC family protein [Mycolicibacterium sp. XJ870]
MAATPQDIVVNDIAAVVATSRFGEALAWYSRIIGRDPDLQPVEGVAEWQLTATAWLQLATDGDRAGRSAVRFGVTDLPETMTALVDYGVEVGEPMVVANMVAILDVTDPDGNEVSFVQDLT